VINLEKERQQIPDDHAPWPLLVVVTDETPVREHSDEYPVAAFNSLMEHLRLTALKHLKGAGRTGDVRMLKLYCYNTKTPKEKE
jgi:hypothetical protein